MQGGNSKNLSNGLSYYQLLCLRHRLVPAVPLGEAYRQAVHTSHLVTTLSTMSSMRTKSTLSTTKAVHASTKGYLREIVRCSVQVLMLSLLLSSFKSSPQPEGEPERRRTRGVTMVVATSAKKKLFCWYKQVCMYKNDIV